MRRELTGEIKTQSKQNKSDKFDKFKFTKCFGNRFARMERYGREPNVPNDCFRLLSAFFGRALFGYLLARPLTAIGQQTGLFLFCTPPIPRAVHSRDRFYRGGGLDHCLRSPFCFDDMSRTRLALQKCLARRLLSTIRGVD